MGAGSWGPAGGTTFGCQVAAVPLCLGVPCMPALLAAWDLAIPLLCSNGMWNEASCGRGSRRRCRLAPISACIRRLRRRRGHQQPAGGGAHAAARAAGRQRGHRGVSAAPGGGPALPVPPRHHARPGRQPGPAAGQAAPAPVLRGAGGSRASQGPGGQGGTAGSGGGAVVGLTRWQQGTQAEPVESSRCAGGLLRLPGPICSKLLVPWGPAWALYGSKDVACCAGRGCAAACPSSGAPADGSLRAGGQSASLLVH